jgi:uncharacterized protein YgbK (DUF1537 family)
VYLLRLNDVCEGVEHARAVLKSPVEDGASYIVTDAIEQRDLRSIAGATADWPFISRGSGITAEMPGLMFADRTPLSFAERIRGLKAGLLVVSGSLSPATRAQNKHALSGGFHGVAVEPRQVLTGETDLGAAVDQAGAQLREGEPVIIYSRADSPEDVQKVQDYGEEIGLSVTETGEKIAGALATVAARLIEGELVGRLIISGGETSGAVCREMGLGVLEVGLPVEPGVPYCFPASHPGLMVVLKSGNFGSEDFYLRVMNIR